MTSLKVAALGSSGNGTNPAISSYSKLTSSFSENMNARSQADAEAAYDIWTAAWYYSPGSLPS